jgi:hypothetical protein
MDVKMQPLFLMEKVVVYFLERFNRKSVLQRGKVKPSYGDVQETLKTRDR